MCARVHVFCATQAAPLCSHSVVGRDVDGVGAGVVLDGQAQVGDDRRAVTLHQHIFRLKVSVGDAGFSYRQANAAHEESYTGQWGCFTAATDKYYLYFTVKFKMEIT